MTPEVAGRRFTVLGAAGFLGRAVVDWLRARGADVRAVTRATPVDHLLAEDLGYVIDCAGLTGDFRERPFDTVESHVSRLGPLLREARLERYVYSSTTRVYRRAAATSEDTPLLVAPTDGDDLYDLTKLTGECFALRTRPEAVVARISNLYGPDPGAGTFLPQLLRAARAAGPEGRYAVRQAATSARDYVSVVDTARWLAAIAVSGASRVYNVAAGVNVTNGEVTARIAQVLGAVADVPPTAAAFVLAPIDARRLHTELGPPEHHLLDDLPTLATHPVFAPPAPEPA